MIGRTTGNLFNSTIYRRPLGECLATTKSKFRKFCGQDSRVDRIINSLHEQASVCTQDSTRCQKEIFERITGDLPILAPFLLPNFWNLEQAELPDNPET